MPKYNMQKNSDTHFVIAQAKKIVTSQGKSPNANMHVFKNANNKWKRQAFMKKRIIGIITHETNLVSGANDEKVPKLASNRISEFF